MGKHRSRFHIWLLEKYDTDSLTKAAQLFSAECNPRISYNTIQKWAEGAKPRDFTKDILRPQFPDCPLWIVEIPPAEITRTPQAQGPVA